jgi:hypothetical protein
MRKLFLIVALIFTLFVALPAQAEIKYMWAEVYRMTNDRDIQNATRITSGVTFQVLQRNSDTLETLYEAPDMATSLTSLTNPVTAANFASDTVCKDRVAFQVDPGEATDTYVDVIVVDTAGGYTAFVEDFDETTHRIYIDESPGVMHHGMIFIDFTGSGEEDTGIDFQYDTAIHRVCVETVTLDAGETLDVGLLSSETSGDANGLVAAASVAAAGIVCNDKPTITADSTENYVSTASVVGALMGNSLAGASTATDEGSGYIWIHNIISANAVSLTYTGSAGTDTTAGYIHYYFTRTR